MAVLCQLADPDGYCAFDWDFLGDPATLEYWLGVFESYPGNVKPKLLADGLSGEGFESRWAEFCTEYQAGLDARRADPTAFPELSTITLGYYRQSLLNKYGWPDPYAVLKRKANELASALYSNLVERIDALPTDECWDPLFRGVLAGNMFDMGAPKTMELYNRGELDFFDTYKKLPDRPWFIDDVDAVRTRFQSGRYERVLFFVDNTGTDIVLGAIPLVRELARGGCRISLAANSGPALNDITIDELTLLLNRLAGQDPVLSRALSDGRITALGTGTDSPLIDLSLISEECNAAAAETDLIVLEGMGRGVESNWKQTFKCDVWRVALVKDECIARWLGCDLFSPVFRFDSDDATRGRSGGIR